MPYNIIKRHPLYFADGDMKLRNKIFLVVLSLLMVLSIGIFFLVKNANLILKHKLEQALGKDFSVQRIDLHWKSIEAFDIAFNKPDGTPIFRADKLSLSLDLSGVLRKQYNLSELVLKNPYFLIEVNRAGKFVGPFSGPGKGKKEIHVPVVSINRIVIQNGSIDYRDGKVSRPPLVTKLRNIALDISDMSIPFSETPSPFDVNARIIGNSSTGTFSGSGRINLKNGDMDSKFAVRNLDITNFKSYFQKRGDADITSGHLDLDVKANIKKGSIYAPGRAVLRDLDFRRTDSLRDRFLGVPRTAVLNLIKTGDNAIAVDFVIEGDLKNPRFSLREKFLEKLTVGLAGKLGLSVTTIGKTIVVGGATQIEKGVKGIGKEIEQIFK